MLSLFLLLALYGLITGLEDEPPAALLLDVGRRGAGAAHQGTHRARSSSSAPPFPICCSPANGGAGARSSRSPALLLFLLPSPRPGTSSAASPIPTRDTRWATIPPSATCTASFTSTSSTSTSCASSACAIRTTTTKCPASSTGWPTWSGSSPGASSCPPLVAVAWKTRRTWLQHLRHDAGQTVDFYLDNADARRRGQLRRCALKFRVRTIWLLSLFSAWTLLFFPSPPTRSTTPFPSGRRS